MNCATLSIRAGLFATIAVTTFVGMSAPAQSQPNVDTITIGPRFSPNPIEAKGNGGGSTLTKDAVGQANTPTGECTGYTNTKPNHTIVLTSFFNALSLQVESSEDTALAIKGPGGVWCNDDFQGKNPGVTGEWLAGTYKVWVSSYTKNRAPAYTLQINEQR